MITVYKNIKDIKSPHYITVETALDRIKNGDSKTKIEKIRKETDSAKKSKLKQSLPSVCFSGKFTERKDSEIQEHSGFVILDFDHEEDVESKKSALENDEYTYAVWISPSGDGLKALIQVPKDIENHKFHYLALVEKYPELDTTSQNLSRVCYESFDPEIYINKDSTLWTGKVLEKKVEPREKPIEINQSFCNTQIDRVLNVLRESGGVEKHKHLLKASRLAGGFIATGEVDESEIRSLLLSEVAYLGADDLTHAEKTITDGFGYGMQQPLSDEDNKHSHVLENRLPLQNNDFSKYLSEKEDEEKWLTDARNGEIPQGLAIGSEHFDRHFRLKKQTLVGFFGGDNVGKTTFHHFLSVCYAKKHGTKFLFVCRENDAEKVRQKVMELFIGKSIKDFDSEEYEQAKEFAYKYFDVIKAGAEVNLDNILPLLEKMYSQKHYDVTFLDPYNAIQYEQTPSANYTFLGKLRMFQKKYDMSFHVSMHISSDKTRNYNYSEKDEITDFNGTILPVHNEPKIPRKSHVEGGQPIANKLDDIIIIHRLPKMEELRNYTMISVDKVKEDMTGGMQSFGNPIMFYKSNGFDTFIDKDKFNPMNDSSTKAPVRVTSYGDYNPNAGIESNRADFDTPTVEEESFDIDNLPE